METEKKHSRGKRGQGCIYLPKNSRNYWIKFSANGRVYQETANTESKNAALNFLRTRVSEVSSGKSVDCKKVTVQSLADSMTKAWELAQKNEATQEWAGRCWKRLLPFFGKTKATDALASAAIMEYQAFRRKQGAANATINRELAVLSCAFTLGYESTPRLVPEKLHFTRLPEPKGRQGIGRSRFPPHRVIRQARTRCRLSRNLGSGHKGRWLPWLAVSRSAPLGR